MVHPVIRIPKSCIDSLSPRFDAQWRSYVDHHADGTVFHTLEWKEAIESGFGHVPHYLLARRGETIIGVLPLFEVNSLLAGRLFVSTPYAVYGGALADDLDTATTLLRKAKQIAREAGARSVELRSERAADASLRTRATHATFRRELPLHVADVAGGLPRKTRAAARRAAERNDLGVTFDKTDLLAVWQLYARSMRRLGSPNYPWRFFAALCSSLGENLVVHTVRAGSSAVAGLVSFAHRDTFMPYFVGVDERAGVYGLSNYLYQQSMCHAVERGFRVYDFGRTRFDNRGSFEFKRSFGFEPTPLEYQTYICPGNQPADLAPSSPRWTQARRIWRHLPLQLTRPLGSWLAKSIPG